MKYNEDIFTNGTLYITSKFNYQVFITRTYVKYLNSFYTTTFSAVLDIPFSKSQ